MDCRYYEAFAEVDYILAGLNSRERSQIPKNLLDIIHEKKNSNYSPHIDLTKSLFEQNLKNETLAILAFLYRKYLINPNEKEDVEQHYYQTLKEPVDYKEQSLQLCNFGEIGVWGKMKKMWFMIKNQIKKTVK
ncbi:MAG: hypothetical protein J6M02_01115 [Clostridia bacterium]|nr:hypothetical protein [Clostridia bacterium]